MKIDPKKMAEKSTCINKQYVKSRTSENPDLKQGIIQKELESINLSAINGTFVTKGESESNFLTTFPDQPKLNHLVNTILNQILI